MPPTSINVEDLPLPAFVSTLDGEMLQANQALMGLLELETMPRACRDLFAEDSQGALPAEVGRATGASVRGTAPSPWQANARRSDGTSVAVSVQLKARLPESGLGGEEGWLVGLVDRPRAGAGRSRELQVAEKRFSQLADGVPVGIVSGRSGLRADYANARCAELLGASREELVGRGWVECLREEDRFVVVSAIEQVLVGDSPEVLHRVATCGEPARQIDLRITAISGADGDAGFVACLTDVTEALTIAERLAAQARTDSLTGLPNRLAVEEEIETLLRAAPDGRGDPAVLFVDIDNFKDVNESLGHSAGDEVLRISSRRLREAVRPSDVVGRFGGDEFVLLLQDQTSPEGIRAVVSRVLQTLALPIFLAGHDVMLTASVGVAWAHLRQADAETLIRNADVALYQAKRAGRNGCAFYDELAREAAQERLSLQSALRSSVEAVRSASGRPSAGGFDVFYQPIVDPYGRPMAFEALCRWTHPQLGPTEPERFLAAAESAGLLPSVDHMVHAAALGAVGSWRSLPGAQNLTVSVNASPRTLVDRALPPALAALLARAELAGSALYLEITEQAVMEDPPAVIKTLESIRSLGVKIAIDDFGTGHSSLAYVRDLPVDCLKIDRSFVSSLGEGSAPAAIVSAIVALARGLDLKVIAEGVETVEQREALVELGVDAMQGWLFSRPVPNACATDWLRTRLGSEREQARL